MNMRRGFLCTMATVLPVLSTQARSASTPSLPGHSAPAGWRRDGVLATGLSSPVGMALDRDGRLLVANWSAGTVVAIDADGKASVIADGLSGPSGLALGPQGELYVASYSDDLIWRLGRDGQKEVFLRGLATPAGLAFDLKGNLLIANRRSNQILAADPAGRISVAVEGGLQTPVGAVQLPDGSYFVSNLNGGVSFAGPDGRARTVSRAFSQPGPGIAIADGESVYVVDYGGTEVKQVSRDGGTRVVAAGLRSPVGLVVAADRGEAIVADWGSNTAYRYRIGTM